MREFQTKNRLNWFYVVLVLFGIFVMDLSFRCRIQGSLQGMRLLYLGHILLLAGLMIASFMDLGTLGVSSWVFNLLFLVGFLTHSIWRPSGTEMVLWSKTFTYQPVLSIIALTMGITVIVSSLFRTRSPESNGEAVEEENCVPLLLDTKMLTGLAVIGLIYVCITVLLWRNSCLPLAGIALLLVSFIIIIRQLGINSESLVETIEEGTSNIRRQMCIEFLHLTPALFVGAIVWFAATSLPHVQTIAQKIMSWPVIQGLSRSMIGWVVGGALGWATRIIFSLVFRKEAYGDGDILLLAAVGSVSGWDVAVLAFFLSVPFGLIFVVASRNKHHEPVLPLIPALTLGTLVAIAYEPAILTLYGL